MSRALLLYMLLALAVGARAADTWNEVKSSEGGFSALFPGTPTQSSKTSPSDVGLLKSQQWVVETDEGACSFLVMCTDYPVDFAAKQKPSEVLERVRPAKSPVKSEKEIKVGDLPGREFVYESGGVVLVKRAFWAQPRLYQLVVGFEPPKDIQRSGDAEKFFNSFQLLK